MMWAGSTLALLVPPIGLLAGWMYYKQGYLEKVFGIAVLLISLKMILAT